MSLAPFVPPAKDTQIGVAVGSGWQALVAYINVGCYYFVGIPLGAFMGFKLGFRVKGDQEAKLEERTTSKGQPLPWYLSTHAKDYSEYFQLGGLLSLPWGLHAPNARERDKQKDWKLSFQEHHGAYFINSKV